MSMFSTVKLITSPASVYSPEAISDTGSEKQVASASLTQKAAHLAFWPRGAVVRGASNEPTQVPSWLPVSVSRA